MKKDSIKKSLIKFLFFLSAIMLLGSIPEYKAAAKSNVIHISGNKVVKRGKIYKKYLGDNKTDSSAGGALKDDGKFSEWTKYASDYFYERMSQNEKTLYDRMERECIRLLTGDDDAIEREDGFSTQLIPYDDLGFTEEEAVRIVWMFFYEEPQYYFLNSVVYSQTGSDPSVALGVYADFANGEVRSLSTKMVKDEIDSWVNMVESYTGDRDREKAAHDITCENLVYEENDFDQGIAGVLFRDGKAVCAGYSKIYMMLCNAAGIETLNITSLSHAWNLSYVEDAWYIVDCTWDDQETGYMYTYFNLTNSEMMALDRQGSHLSESMWMEKGMPFCETEMPESPTVFYLKYELDGGTNSGDNPERYKEADEVYLKDPVKEGYWFKGWYLDNDEKIVSFSGINKKDYVLKAKWEKAFVEKAEIKKYKKKQKLLVLKSTVNSQGYEVLYSIKKGFPEKSTYMADSKKLKIRLKGIGRKKKFFVKARAYTIDSAGVKTYGKYSKVFKAVS